MARVLAASLRSGERPLVAPQRRLADLALALRWLAPPLARALGASLALYILAKLAETFDARVYELSAHALGGHTLKHLPAAASAAALLPWQRRALECAPRPP